jgi:cation:H+ antiporter
MPLAIGAVLFGVLCLWQAADQFVEGATRLALIFRLSPVVIGALIIGFGTSAPELLVSSLAAAGGDVDVGVGNIIGSNIANLSLILGAASLILTMPIGPGALRREAPLSVAAVVLFAISLRVGLGVTTGLIMLVALAGALWLIMRTTNDELTAEVAELAGEAEHNAVTESARTLIGMAFTVGGAWVLVWGALDLADRLGVGGGFMGLTLVAIGTSLPELVTVIAAARAKQAELIVGNLLGSNLFNSLAVGGSVSLLGSGPVVDRSLITQDAMLMTAVAVAAFVAMWTRRKFERLEGLVLLTVFVGFLVYTYVSEGPAV